MRLFAALDPPSDLKSAISSLLKKASWPAIRWIPEESLHLTLKFFGETSELRAAELRRRLAALSTLVAPFSLFLRKGGVFPREASPRVFWTGVEGDLTPLAGLVRRLEESINGLGIPPEERDFKAHLTVGRIRTPVKGPDGVKLSRQFGTLFSSFETEKFPVTKFHLYQSHLTSTGAQYRILQSFPLEAP